MSEETTEVQEVESTTTIHKMDNTPEQMPLAEQLANAQKRTEEIRDSLINGKFEIDLDDDYKDRMKYLQKVKLFINKEMKYIGHDFFIVELMHNEIADKLKGMNPESNKPIEFSYNMIEGFVKLFLQTEAYGYKTVKERKYLFRPFNNGYAKINDMELAELKELENIVSNLSADIQAEDQNAKLADNGQTSAETEEISVDVPQTIERIQNLMTDVNNVLSIISDQMTDEK